MPLLDPDTKYEEGMAFGREGQVNNREHSSLRQSLLHYEGTGKTV